MEGIEVSKKKKTVIIIVAISIVLLAILAVNMGDIVWNIQHPHDMSGYYYNINDLREDIDRDNLKSRITTPTYYENNDYLFSKDFGDIIIDFVIKDDQIAIVRINCKEENGNKKFGLLSSASPSLDNIISKSENEDDYAWHKVMPGLASPTGSTQVRWCIVSESSGLYDEKYGSFKFTYSGATYYILYEIIPKT